MELLHVVLLFALVIVGILLIMVYVPKSKPKPQVVLEKENDKLIIVSNISVSEIDRVLTSLHDEQPRLFKIDENQFAITFPHNVHFDTFCHMINFIKDAIGFDKPFDLTGWTTTKSDEMWVVEKSANKRVMLFICENDTEYDNVFLTTSDNIGYKVGFGMREMQELKAPVKRFVEPSIEMVDLETMPYRDYE